MSAFTEKELTPRAAFTYSIRYVWGLEYWALEIGDKVTHHFTRRDAKIALIEYLQENLNLNPNGKSNHNQVTI